MSEEIKKINTSHIRPETCMQCIEPNIEVKKENDVYPEHISS